MAFTSSAERRVPPEIRPSSPLPRTPSRPGLGPHQIRRPPLRPERAGPSCRLALDGEGFALAGEEAGEDLPGQLGSLDRQFGLAHGGDALGLADQAVGDVDLVDVLAVVKQGGGVVRRNANSAAVSRATIPTKS